METCVTYYVLSDLAELHKREGKPPKSMEVNPKILQRLFEENTGALNSHTNFNAKVTTMYLFDIEIIENPELVRSWKFNF